MLKLSTRPAITRYGRSRSDSDAFGGCLGGDRCRRRRRLGSRTLWVPEKKMTGSTGRMHGEMPVINPPMKPIAMSVNMLIRSAVRKRMFGTVEALLRTSSMSTRRDRAARR